MKKIEDFLNTTNSNPEIKIGKNLIYFNFSMSLFKDEELRSLLEKDFWIYRAFESAKPFNSTKIIKTVNVSFNSFITGLFNSLEIFLSENNLNVVRKKDFISGEGNLPENIVADMTEIIENEIKVYLFSKPVDLEIKYSIDSSSVALILNKNILTVKTQNKEKKLTKSELKKIVNKLSLLTQLFNEGFSKLGKSKATQYAFYLNRKNGFEVIDKVLLEL